MPPPPLAPLPPPPSPATVPLAFPPSRAPHISGVGGHGPMGGGTEFFLLLQAGAMESGSGWGIWLEVGGMFSMGPLLLLKPVVGVWGGCGAVYAACVG